MRTLYPLIIALLLLVQGCSSGPALTPQQTLEQNFQVLREAAMKAIADEARVNQFFEHARRLESVVVEYNQAFSRFAAELGELNRNSHTPRSAQEALLAQFTERRLSAMEQVIELHFQMVTLTTASEWKDIVKYETEALGAIHQLPEGQNGADS